MTVTVAVVAPRYGGVGGMQNYARRVVSWLQSRDDYDVVVITSGSSRRTVEHVDDGVRVIALGTWLTLSNTPVNPLWLWQLRRLFRRLGVDVVNAHSPVPYLADVAVLAAGRRRPTVLTYHAGSLVKGTGGVVDAALRWYERVVLPRVFNRAARLVAVSPVATTVRTGRAAMITPGVDTAAFTMPPAGSTRERSIVYVGRVERTSRWKGLHVLLEALPSVLETVPDAVLEIVGDGDAVPELTAQAARLGIADRVRWHGALPQPAVNAVLQGAGVSVLPSITEAESFGMTLIEAMAAGCPVVGSAIGGIPHVIRDGVDGLLVPPGDAIALAAGISRVLTDRPLAQRLGKAGRDAAEQTWEWAKQEERTMHELDQALADAQRRQPVAGTEPRHAQRRLAVVTDTAVPWMTGGKEQRQHELLTRLARRGFAVDVYTMRWWEDGKTLSREGITYHAICPLIPLYSGGRRSIWQALVFALASLRMITRRFDVLEVDAIPFLQLFPTRIVAWLRRKPMVVTWHEYWGSQYWTDYLGPLGRLAALIEKTAIHLPDRILAASDGTAERLRTVRRAPVDVQVVTPGIVAATLHGGAATTYESTRPVRLLCAGRLLSHKKVDVAITACAQLIRSGVAAHLTVLGTGPEAESLRDLARTAGIADHVEFIEHLPEHRDVLTRMAEADLFLFPSVREGFGMVALEAMAVGTPVITSDHPDNFARHLVRPDVSGLVCPATPDSFAAAIRSCLNRLVPLSAAAAELAADFDWDRIADRAEKAYALAS